MKDKKSLKSFNTFGIEVFAKDIIHISHDNDILKFLSSSQRKYPFYVLGDGSNVLFTEDYDGIILKMETKGIEIVSQNKEKALVKAKAGEDWDTFVRYCLAHNFCGLENLALIPGKVGSSPIQNIGAYGQEVKNFITKVYAISVSDMSFCTFVNKDCQFGYRTSIFKQSQKDRYIITDVEFMLTIDGVPDITYKDIQTHLSAKAPVKAQDVYNAVSYIRTVKLPDWKVLGNAGSFFKNPVVSVSHFTELKNKYPFLKAYPVEKNKCKLSDGDLGDNGDNGDNVEKDKCKMYDGDNGDFGDNVEKNKCKMYDGDNGDFGDNVEKDKCKMSAAQLIDISGWKGKRIGDAGVHVNQPLVLINYGNAKGKDILNLARQIQNSVYDLSKIKLEIEVNIK